VATRGLIPLEQIWDMLDACAPGHEMCNLFEILACAKKHIPQLN